MKLNFHKNYLYFKISNQNKFIKFIKYFFLTIIILTTLISIFPKQVKYCETEEEIEMELEDNINDQINNLDLSELEKILQNLDDQYSLFGNVSVKEKIQQILNGNYFTDFGSVLGAIASIVFGNIKNYLPLLISIFAIAILTQIISNFNSNKVGSNIKEIVDFVAYSLVIILVVFAFKDVSNLTINSLNLMKNQIEILFPILLTILTAIGSVATVAIYNPILAILTTGISLIFTNFLYPIFIIAFIFVVIGNISNSVKLEKFSGLISSIFKWVVGFIFTIFGGILTIKSISAGKYDSVSISATRFAIKSYVPIIGGYLSEGLDFIMLSSVLIKNAVGLAGLIILFITIISPIVSIVIFKLGLQFISAILEPIGNQRICKFTSECSKVLIYPIVILLGVAFMYILSVALVICTANII